MAKPDFMTLTLQASYSINYVRIEKLRCARARRHAWSMGYMCAKHHT
jgi:hypothetical protein